MGKNSLIPLLGDTQGHFVLLSELCETETRFSYEARRISIWNLIEQHKKNKLNSSWFEATKYIHKAISFISNNVQPTEETWNFRDFDMESWFTLMTTKESETSGIISLLTSWCLNTTKCTNNHAVIANFYRYVLLFLDFLAEPTASHKEFFSASLQTCIDLCESHDYPAEVANHCFLFLKESASVMGLCSYNGIDLCGQDYFKFSGRLCRIDEENFVVFHDFQIPVKETEQLLPFIDGFAGPDVDVLFSVAFS